MIKIFENKNERRRNEKTVLFLFTAIYSNQRNRRDTPVLRPLTLKDVRREIKTQLRSRTATRLCSPSDKVCTGGPPGPKGDPGLKGRRGKKGESEQDRSKNSHFCAPYISFKMSFKNWIVHQDRLRLVVAHFLLINTRASDSTVSS